MATKPKVITPIEARQLKNRLLDQNSITGRVSLDVEIAQGVLRNLATWLDRIAANTQKAQDIATEIRQSVHGDEET